MGSAGVGTMGHLASAYLAAKADIMLTHVPFRGSAPALTAVMGGHVQVLPHPPFTAMPAIEVGKHARARSDGCAAVPAAAECANRCGTGFSGLRRWTLGRLFCPRRHTAGRDFKKSQYAGIVV